MGPIVPLVEVEAKSVCVTRVRIAPWQARPVTTSAAFFNRHDLTDSAASVLFVPLESIHRSPL